MNVSGKFVIVTGAAGGIGAALTRRFLAEGASVCAVDREEEALETLALELGSPPALLTIEADISSEESCGMMAAQIGEAWGVVDVLVNNAGWFPFSEFEGITYAVWRSVMAVNLDGPFLMIQAILPLLKKSRAGRIVNMGSGSVFVGPPNQVHYVSAKAGILGLTRSLANALGQYDITVNIVAPGLTATPALVAALPAAVIDTETQSRALKRRETAEDLVGAVLFLASEDAAFITGQTINVDGGSSFV